jgi:hypothetical protein
MAVGGRAVSLRSVRWSMFAVMCVVLTGAAVPVVCVPVAWSQATVTTSAAPDTDVAHDSLGLRQASSWLLDSLPRVASFTLHDRLNGKPAGDATRTLTGVHLDGCAIAWTIGTVSTGASSQVVISATLDAIDPSLITVVRRDTTHIPAGLLIHDPPVWAMTAPTRDGSSPVRFENTTNKVHLTLPTLDLFVDGRDDAWRTAAAIASVARACQNGIHLPASGSPPPSH